MGFGDLDLSPLKKLLPDIEVFDNTLPDERVERIRDAEVILCNKVQLDAETLATANSVRFIGLTATGTDNVDLEFVCVQQLAGNVRVIDLACLFILQFLQTA